jgi:starch synthase
VLREEAQGIVDTHNPAVIARNRHSWMIFTVPEKPVAGADLMVYFNKAQSETLRCVCVWVWRGGGGGLWAVPVCS